MGLIRRRIVLIHYRPQPPTLTLISHVPIAMHMGMMSIIVSHFTHSYNKAIHRTLMLVKAKVLGKARRGNV